jgi:hypothetical protein
MVVSSLNCLTSSDNLVLRVQMIFHMRDLCSAIGAGRRQATVILANLGVRFLSVPFPWGPDWSDMSTEAYLALPATSFRPTVLPRITFRLCPLGLPLAVRCLAAIPGVWGGLRRCLLLADLALHHGRPLSYHLVDRSEIRMVRQQVQHPHRWRHQTHCRSVFKVGNFNI